ncbi:hypothetical protein [Phytoactinopolyspora mesophila]|uniref:hypothetical protein n=1 Tax=Phytoactinopolyspora mesophila TaxID=2650750 RepID=UPI001651BD53|nr:hypothetical protein [Phytoactinopolyspora mesophila]
MFPRRFALVRHVDYTGISGVGVVAYGVVFSDGHVALRWCSEHPATSLWNSIDDVLAIHGHGDATSVQWIDDTTDRLQEAMEMLGASPGRRARRAPQREDSPSYTTRPVELRDQSTELYDQSAESDDEPDASHEPSSAAYSPPDNESTAQSGPFDYQPVDAAPPPPPPPSGQPHTHRPAPHWHSHSGVPEQTQESPTSMPQRDDPIVPPQRSSGGKHRKRTEPTEESAGRR